MFLIMFSALIDTYGICTVFCLFDNYGINDTD